LPNERAQAHALELKAMLAKHQAQLEATATQVRMRVGVCSLLLTLLC
jgi:hypothetical protein